MISINLNTLVTFELSDLGQEMLIKYYTDLMLIPPQRLKENTMPLWEVAYIFGPKMYMGCTPCPIVGCELRIT